MTVSDPDGYLSATALAGHPNGEEWANFMKVGITFRVLKWETPTEVAGIISAARNKVINASLLEYEWTAMRQLNGIVMEDNSQMATEVVWAQYVQLATKRLGQDVAAKPITAQLIALVHSFGPGTKFIEKLCCWAKKW